MAIRIFLFATAIVFLGFGLWGLLQPSDMLSRFGVSLTDPDAKTAIRAMYGGFLIGAAVLFAFCGLSPDRVKYGLQSVLLLSSTILVCRIFGMTIDGSFSAYHLSYAAFELIGIGLSAIFLFIGRKAS